MTDGGGTVEAIWIKRAKLGPMDRHERVRALAGRGLAGNADQGGKRQVTILSAESWADAEAELGAAVDPRARRANLFLRGVDLEESRGRVLRIGPCRIALRGETRPCRRMDEAHRGLKAALEPRWRAGAYGEVLDDGEIAVGDAAVWVAGEVLGEPPAR
jgi:MOSC domain-containing protein YiiM